MSRQFQENYSLPNKLQYEEEGHPEIRFVVADNTKLYQKGMAVTLSAAGEVDFATATDFVIGWVKTPNTPDNNLKNEVVIVTVFQDVVYGYAKTAGLTVGDLVSADGQSTVDGNFSDYIVAATGQYASGIALSTVAVTEKTAIGVLGTPVYKA